MYFTGRAVRPPTGRPHVQVLRLLTSPLLSLLFGSEAGAYSPAGLPNIPFPCLINRRLVTVRISQSPVSLELQQTRTLNPLNAYDRGGGTFLYSLPPSLTHTREGIKRLL